ncbi:MAG: DUF934 domain-containing protein [Myxococcota bacterium]|nr:DUF934 domain-containing protein [Myxococcota bacterium]
MPLLKSGEIVEDPFARIETDAALPDSGAVLVDLARWQQDRESLIARDSEVGVQLSSSECPSEIADDLAHLALVALDFPAFTDGRAYSSARLLRERYGFAGEVRAVGDVLIEQLHFMDRAGFNSFAFDSEQPLEDWKTAQADMKVWYQPTGDARPTVNQLRRR